MSEHLTDADQEDQRTIERLRADNLAYRDHAAGNFWSWQGDGEDHPESLCCPVLMKLTHLHGFLELEAEVLRLRAENASLIRSLQRIQPGGSPPPGDACLLADWIVLTVAGDLAAIISQRDELLAAAGRVWLMLPFDSPERVALIAAMNRAKDARADAGGEGRTP